MDGASKTSLARRLSRPLVETLDGIRAGANAGTDAALRLRTKAAANDPESPNG